MLPANCDKLNWVKFFISKTHVIISFIYSFIFGAITVLSYQDDRSSDGSAFIGFPLPSYWWEGGWCFKDCFVGFFYPFLILDFVVFIAGLLLVRLIFSIFKNNRTKKSII